MPTIVSNILAGIITVALTVLCCIFILPEKKRAKHNKIFGIIADIFTFKDLLLDKILTVLYTFSTIACIVTGIFYLISINYYFSWDGKLNVSGYMGLPGLILLVGGPIAVRIVFEIIMMFVLLVKNTIAINNKLSANVEVKTEEQAPVVEPEPEYVPNMLYCVKCGTQYDANKGNCPNGCQH